MKSMAISVFKTFALKVIDEVSKNREPVLITKRGKPIAELIPYQGGSEKKKPGALSGTLVFEKDIVSPMGEDEWESCR